MKKISSLCLVLVLVINSIFFSLGIPISANAEENLPSEEPIIEDHSIQEEVDIENTTGDTVEVIVPPTTVDSASIITNVTLETKEGELIDADKNPTNQPLLGSEVIIKYEWKLENGHKYKDGDNFVFQLPEQFELYNEFDGNLVAGFGTVGTFVVTKDGKVTFTFNNNVETHSNISGTFEVWSIFSKTTITGSTHQVIKFPIQSGELEIPIVFSAKPGKTIEKSGKPNTNYNASSIDWTVDVNKQLDTIAKAVVKDPIEDGQELVSGSIKIYSLEMQLDGTAEQGEELDSNLYRIEKTEDGKDFEIHFVSDEINEAYRIAYKTNITDADKTTYSNTATLSGENISDAKATSTVSVKRGVPLAKETSGYDPINQTIQWRIKFNYNEKNITKENAFLEDFLPAGHDLVNDSLKVYKVTFDSSGKETSEPVDSFEYTLTDNTEEDSHSFTLQFKNDITSAIKIEYETTASEPIIDSGSVINKVVYNEEEKSATSPIQQGVLAKGYTNENYKDKTVEWKIDVNKNKYKMDGLVLKDKFVSGGLELFESSFTITTADKEVLARDTDYKLEVQDEGFTITFTETIEKHLIITYKTKFDPSYSIFSNNARISWGEFSKEVTANFKPDNYTIQNGYKNGSYNPITKEITWEIGINYNLKSISKAIIEDYILQGQKLVDGSIEVFHAEPLGGKDEFSKGAKLSEDTYTVDTIENGETSGFKLAFNQSINSGYIITYKTTLDNQLIVEKYDNTATLYDDTQKLTDLKASVAVKHGGEYVNKDGLQNGKVIDWTVYINRGQSTIADAAISDTPSDNLILVEDSFVVYKTKVNQDGTISKGDILDSNDYILEFIENDEGKPTFKLSFKNIIETAYILEYKTYINAQNGATVSNKVKLNGAGLTTELTETSKSIEVKLSGGGGSGSGETGQLVVTKVDADNTEKLLPGAKFTLYDSEGKIPIKTVATDDKGQAIFDGLLYDDYVLKETAALEGYFIEIQVEETVKIDKQQVSLTVTNKKLHQAVELTKLDADDASITLADATFKLLRYNGTEFVDIGLTDLKTDENGKLAIQNLQPGEYQLIETVAPLGYKLDATPIPFTIVENQTESVKVSHVNKKHIDAVELTKVKKGDHSVTLAGAVFDLLDEYGNVILKDLTTNNEGKILIPTLQPGNYQFIETKSPSGYRLNTAPLTFTIENDQKETVKVTFENEVIRSGGGGGGNSGGGNGGNNGGNNPGGPDDNNGGGNNPGDPDGNNGGGNNPGDSDGDNNGGNNPGDTDGDNNGGSNPGGSDGNNNNGNNPGKPNGNNGGGSSGDTNGNNGGKNPGKPNGNNSGNSNGEVAAGNSNNSNSDTNYELPKTATNMYSLLVIGLLLLLSAFSIMFVTKLRNS